MTFMPNSPEARDIASYIHPQTNPRAHQELAPFGKAAGLGFVFLAALLALATFGWLRCRAWGWKLTVILITAQIVGNVANIVSDRVVEGAVGVVIATALVVYLFRQRTRDVFHVAKK